MDNKTNGHGELFIEFMINANLCMLNGRCECSCNNFTSVSSKRCSVVDYCITSHFDLSCAQHNNSCARHVSHAHNLTMLCTQVIKSCA